MLLAGGDPASWPNAELALANLPAVGGQRVRLLEPDSFEELDGIGGRATRYRGELARGAWQPAPAGRHLMSHDPRKGSNA